MLKHWSENDIGSYEIFEVKFREIKKKIREIKKNWYACKQNLLTHHSMSQKQIYEQNEWFEATNDEHLTLLVVYCFEFLLRENFNIKDRVLSVKI